MTANRLKTTIHLEMRENNQMNHRAKQWQIIILQQHNSETNEKYTV